jgi:hypothetical protein
MPEAETGKAAQLVDLLLKFFANERHWLRGGYHDGHGRRCLINAVHHLGNKHGLPCDPVMSALDEALPERRVGLVIFNDQHCCSIAELRTLILKARAIAIRNDEHERAAAALERRLLREIEEERAAQSAAGDDHSDAPVSGNRLRRPRSRDCTAMSRTQGGSAPTASTSATRFSIAASSRRAARSSKLRSMP